MTWRKALTAALVATLFTFGSVPTSARRALPATDDLTRTASTLGSNWTAASGDITDWLLFDGNGEDPGATADFSGADFALAYWNADAFNDDQYSQAVVTVGTNGYIGVAVRLSGTTGSQNGYGVSLEVAAGGCDIYKWVSGTRSTIGSCSVTWTNGHTLRISVTGSSITVTDNGSTIGTATDSAVTTGDPGLLGYSDTGSLMTNWQGDNVGGGGGPTINPAIINTPIRGGGLPVFFLR